MSEDANKSLNNESCAALDNNISPLSETWLVKVYLK